MKRNLLKLGLFFMLAICLSACGRDGLDGKDGLDGTYTDVRRFEIKANDWVWNNAENAYIITRNFPEFDIDFFDYGSVNVYIADGDYDCQLPWTLYYSNETDEWSEMFSYKIKPGVIVFFLTPSDSYRPDVYEGSMKAVITLPL